MGKVIERDRNLAKAVFRDALVDKGFFANRFFKSEDGSRAAEFFCHFKDERSGHNCNEASCDCANCGESARHHKFFFAGQSDPAKEHEKTCDGLLREPFEILHIKMILIIANAKKGQEELNNKHP